MFKSMCIDSQVSNGILDNSCAGITNDVTFEESLTKILKLSLSIVFKDVAMSIKLRAEDFMSVT